MAPAGSSTVPADVTKSRARRARNVRRAYLTIVGAFVVLGMLNVFGSKTSSVSAAANGYSLRVEYPAATRSSLPVNWQVFVTHAGGFDGPVRIGVPIDYWGLFDFNNFYPTPDSTQEDQSVTGAMLAVGTFGVLVLLFSYTSFRLPKTRPALEGLAIVVVRDGEPIEASMRYERITLDEVKDAARAQGIADLGEIRLGILEPGGAFSFLKRDEDDDEAGDQPSVKEH